MMLLAKELRLAVWLAMLLMNDEEVVAQGGDGVADDEGGYPGQQKLEKQSNHFY